MKRHFCRQKTIWFSLVLAVILSAACSGKNSGVSYEFTNIRRGSLERTVSASGAINPVSSVKVLPQMSGKVEKIYVDYNDAVRKGDVLAELNTDMLRLRREQQYASVIKARSNYQLQELNYRGQTALAEKGLISEYELKASRTTLDSYRADLAVAESNLKSIETEINQYAFIKSPIDGIVLDRKINIGDTVADTSSSNSTAIFTLAENLKEMQIEAYVGELDIASIRKGQEVRFSLESMPGRNFSGEVETLRMVPVVANNVVSYTVVVKVENQDGTLLPGMTCAVEFIVERAEDVLMVSNAALRYQPTSLPAEEIEEMVFIASLEKMDDEQKQAATAAREEAKAKAESSNQNNNSGLAGIVMGGGSGGRMMRGMGGGGRAGSGQGGQNRARPAVVVRNLWYLSDQNKLTLLRVETGITNGTFTEIISAEDLEGKQVIQREKI